MSAGDELNNRYYGFIDGLRALAILLVICHHMFYFFGIYAIFSLDSLIGSIAEGGRCGVDIFFVISGFLITGVMLRNYEEPVKILRFYKRRFF